MDILELTYDLKKRTEGVKIPLGGDAYLLIAEHGTPAFYEAYTNHKKDHEQTGGDLDLKALTEIYCKSVVDAVLLGWGGLSEGGEDVPYSKEKALEWLLDPAKEPLAKKVEEESKKFANFKAERLEDEKKP